MKYIKYIEFIVHKYEKICAVYYDIYCNTTYEYEVCHISTI